MATRGCNSVGPVSEEISVFLWTADKAPTYESLADYFGYKSAWQLRSLLLDEGVRLRDLIDRERELRLIKYNFKTARQAYKPCMFCRDDHFSKWYKARYGMSLRKHRKLGGING